jgi:RNA polymerase sigma-70 factor (ECF subfamily)
MEARTAVLGGFIRERHSPRVGRLQISEVVSLVEQAKAGNREAFESLMRAYSGFVYSLALGMLGRKADAEDAFQETFMKAWSHLPSFRTGGNFTQWIKRIATNLCLDRLKKSERRYTHVDSQRVEEACLSEQGDQKAQQREHLEIVNLLLAELPPRHRAAVVLFYLEDQSVKEVARTLRRRPSTVRVWLFRAREKMKAALEAKGYEL